MRVLDGVWHGYYLEESIGNPALRANHFPIRAEFQTKGTRILGEMTDEKPITELPVRVVYEKSRHRLDAKQRGVYEEILRQDPKARAVYRLPSQSRLHGRVEGRRVSFAKEYQGIYRVDYVVLDESRTIYESSRHVVRYEGELDANTDAIEGQWTIHKQGLLGLKKTPLAIGRFRLDRR
jgi:hypothetical protein